MTNVPLDDLDQFLADAIAEAAAKKKSKEEKTGIDKARERIVRGIPEPLDGALVAAWAEKYDWQAVASVAAFCEAHCETCRRTVRLFQGFFIRQRHAREARSFRWIAQTAPDTVLPKETLVKKQMTKVCEYCIDTTGWAMDGPAVWVEEVPQQRGK